MVADSTGARASSASPSRISLPEKPDGAAGEASSTTLPSSWPKTPVEETKMTRRAAPPAAAAATRASPST